MYGPEYQRIKIIWDLEMRWARFPVLPSGMPPASSQGITPSPWLPPSFECDQDRRATRWYDDYQVNSPEVQRSYPLSPEQGRALVPQVETDLVTLLGPWNEQKEFRLGRGNSLVLSDSGLPVDDPDAGDDVPTGWMLDLESIPLAMGWAPSFSKNTQLLAVATVPFSDQELPVQDGDADSTEQATASGCIQFWEFVATDQDVQDLATPSDIPPRLVVAKCFDWGRPKRLQWCPVPMDSAGIYGMLAVLCGDGQARIIDVNRIVDDTDEPVYDWIESPVVTLGLSDYNVDVTCLTWVNTNRIVLGHSDGSVTLWSIYPRKLIQRVGVHTTYVIDICSGYPSSPYLIASIPVGGCATLTDLSQPSSELTYFPVPAINFQPNMLCWNETMQGFMTLYPSSTPNTTIAFLHHRYFCQARSICTGPNTVTCVSVGATHPFLLVGCADGSVFSCNALQKLFKQKGEPLRKIKIFEHEYRPLATTDGHEEANNNGQGVASPRGATRILHGFLPELNDDPRTEKRKEMDRKKRMERKKATGGKKKKGRPGKKAGALGGDDDDDDREAEIDGKLASRVVTHEPLTRVTTMEWNPNLRFSCWAACAMASGLVKVMNLGVQ
ncbi:WD40-repeat-containing domain protein [Bombardia bombarda]|uniref:WD40-repeat-containing domain protein n=1 Tax=Bombardia bombarda TaxID=252184 RepID=A0AA40C1C8_9PEZI|nr:WD40-repeat-containing domain protein [Bombardia bombarda]